MSEDREVPICKDCKYFQENIMTGRRCAHPVNRKTRQSLVTGFFEMPECKVMRSGGRDPVQERITEYCGEAGHLFEARDG